MSKVTKITLEDRGQDFTEWYVRDGIVIDCQPFQGDIWVGSKVKLDGDRISVKTRSIIGFMSLKYRAVGAVELEAVEAAEVEGYGRKWADMIGITVESLGLTV